MEDNDVGHLVYGRVGEGAKRGVNAIVYTFARGEGHVRDESPLSCVVSLGNDTEPADVDARGG